MKPLKCGHRRFASGSIPGSPMRKNFFGQNKKQETREQKRNQETKETRNETMFSRNETMFFFFYSCLW